MGFNCGIVGLPNVGKSTIFNALTNAGAAAANFPFCTIDPNVGVVAVPDERLKKLMEIFHSEKMVPTPMEFVDIAGLVAGASKGEGLGNKFLGHIREVHAIAHVVRCFDDPDVVHVHGDVDPIRDIEVIDTELLLADVQSLENRIDRNNRLLKSGDAKLLKQQDTFKKLLEHLNAGKPARSFTLTDEEKETTKDLFLITQKPVLYVCNVHESELSKETEPIKKVKDRAKSENAPVVVISGKIESEISQMAEEEKITFLADYGLKESGLDQMIRAGYSLLGLITYFTAGPKEAHAWTIKQGTLAPQAAGVIHTDFEKGFIRAEVYNFDDLIKLGSETKVKEAGLKRQEGKEYVVKDGDIMLFKFNV